MVLWYYGTMVLWYYGTMVLWYYGTMVLWYYGTMVLWYYGTMAKFSQLRVLRPLVGTTYDAYGQAPKEKETCSMAKDKK